MNVIQFVMFLGGLCVIARMDAKERRIPNKILCLLVLCRILWLFHQNAGWSSSFAGAFLGGCLFMSLYFIFPGNVGAGDVKLCAVLGLYLGSEYILQAVFAAAVYALLCRSILLVFCKRDRGIPFGTFLFFGVITVMLIYREGVW